MTHSLGMNFRGEKKNNLGNMDKRLQEKNIVGKKNAISDRTNTRQMSARTVANL